MLLLLCWRLYVQVISLSHGLSDKHKDFLQLACASELSTAPHVSLVKTVIDE